MTDPLNWCKPSFCLCEQPDCELKQAIQLQVKDKKGIQWLTPQIFTHVTPLW